MAFLTESELRGYSESYRLRSEARDYLKDYSYKADITVFLSHSHSDKSLVKGFMNLLASFGISVYVDWKDSSMPNNTNATTADKIKDKIGDYDLFMMLATKAACESRWVPWEVGVADEKKVRDQVIIIPVKDPSGDFHGNEYLQLYPHLEAETSSFSKFGVFDPGRKRKGVLTEDYLRQYVS